LVPGSLNGDPGELAALPGVPVAPPCPHCWGDGKANAGAAAAPVMTMPAIQLAAKSLRIMITFRSGRAPSRTLHLEYGGDRRRVRNATRKFPHRPTRQKAARICQMSW
jgi:hypothetical protein